MPRAFVQPLSELLVAAVVLIASAAAQPNEDFTGQWVFRLGSRVLILLTITPAGSGTQVSGALMRPQHFSTNTGTHFSGIKGPTVAYAIVRSETKGNCLAFTTQNPNRKDDQDNYQFCLAGPNHGSLKLTEAPSIEPLSMTREKAPVAVSADWDSTRVYYVDATDLSNPEMQKIFDADQKPRQGDFSKIDWAVVSKEDAERREATRKLLATGQLHTGEDFEWAAFIFQHGETPDDYLLAHTLAMVAVARGQASAIWIAAATLDRYLQNIHQPQIYGTQFLTPQGKPVTQEPYNRTLVSDALRRDLDVPSQAAQDERRKEYDAENAAH